MLRLQYKGEFLDLAPGQDGELTRNSPLFNGENAMAEYSTPIVLAGTGRNARLIGFLFFDPTQKKQTKIDVVVYTGSTYRSRATLVIESAGMNRVFADKGNATGYLLTGISAFFALVKDKKLTQLSLGGERAGSIALFRDSLNFTEDFVCQPCRNELWDGNTDPGSQDWMNELDATGTVSEFADIAPFVKLEYLLTQIFREHGWTLETDELNDEDWKRLIMFTAVKLLQYDTIYLQSTFPAGTFPIKTPHSPIVFSLPDFMPADVTIADFILSLFNRFGWVPICDAETKACSLFALKEAGNGEIKDWTQYSAITSEADFSGTPKIFQFKNTFEGGDQLPSSPSFEGYHIDPPRYSKSQLPDLTQYNSYYDGRLIFVFKENQWFSVSLDPDTNARQWSVFADNIYDAEKSDATDTIETKCTTLPNYLAKWRTANSVDYYGSFPTCKQSRFDKWGIRLVFFRGPVYEQQLDNNGGFIPYPYAGATCIAPNNQADLTWSNVYKHEYNGIDKGIIAYWWKNWLDKISQPDEVKRKYNLPFHEWIKFRWNDIILDNGIPYMVKSVVEHVAYKGFVQCTMQRISLAQPALQPAKLYIQMVWENLVHTGTFNWGSYAHFTDADHGDVVIYLWEDSGATVPATPDNLLIYYADDYSVGNPPPAYSNLQKTIRLNNHRTVLAADTLKQGVDTAVNFTWLYNWHLIADASYEIL